MGLYPALTEGMLKYNEEFDEHNFIASNSTRFRRRIALDKRKKLDYFEKFFKKIQKAIEIKLIHPLQHIINLSIQHLN